MAPFNDAIVISFGEKYVTLSTIIPMLHGLTTALQNYGSIDADDFSDQFRRKLQGSLNNRFHNKYHQIKFHLPAMVVDHRFKDVLLSENQSVGARNSPMQYLEDIGPCDTVNITESNGEEIASTASTVWDAFDEAARRKARKIAFPKQTVMQTKWKPILLRHAFPENPLDFWKENVKIPEYFSGSQNTLAIPGTAVPSERVWSDAGNTVKSARQRLLPSNTRMLLFLN